MIRNGIHKLLGTSATQIYRSEENLRIYRSFISGPWSQQLDALVPGPSRNIANGPGPKCNGPWSLGPFDQWSLVPGTPFRVSSMHQRMTSSAL